MTSITATVTASQLAAARANDLRLFPCYTTSVLASQCSEGAALTLVDPEGNCAETRITCLSRFDTYAHAWQYYYSAGHQRHLVPWPETYVDSTSASAAFVSQHVPIHGRHAGIVIVQFEVQPSSIYPPPELSAYRLRVDSPLEPTLPAVPA